MKKKVTDDPQFHWWEREMSARRLTLSADITAVATTLTFASGAYEAKAGDILRLEKEAAGDYELMRVTANPVSDTSLTVEREFAGTTGIAVTVATDNPNLMMVGSVYEEGVDVPRNVRYRPSKIYNYTEIFRDSLQATRTAMNTRLRTVDEVRDAKTQTLLYHSIGMEQAFIFGKRYEAAGSGGNPERMTGGIVSFIDPNNIVDQAGAAVDFEQMEDWMLEMFRWGSTEKVGFLGNRALLMIQRMARLNASLEITPATKEFGMDVRRLFGPSGTLVLKTHPLFNQNTSVVGTYLSLDTWMLVLDMQNLTYRPLRNSDTQYLPDRQGNGIDGLQSEYLTEAGLEVQHGKTHFLLKGLQAAQVDD
jgi:hypothetical protein